MHRQDHTEVTSSVNRGLMPARSSTVRSKRVQPLSSASFTAAPLMWCVSLNGTPAPQKESVVWLTL